jgi:HAD superfamily hydrolase (TIGR01662 family)
MDAEIVIICGYNAAGKSTIVEEFVAQGYFRINRDLTGGKLDTQAVMARTAYEEGHHKIVLDNTYITIESRETIIQTAQTLGVPIRCVWLSTSFEDSQFNACLRMVKLAGKILSPDELKKSKNPNLFPPAALYSARNRFEGKEKTLKYPGKQNPKVTEGFYVVEERKFVRTWPDDYTNEAIIFDFDDTLRKSTGTNPWPTKPSEVEILPGRIEKLAELKAQGKLLLGASNQSAIAKGLPEKDCVDCFEKTIDSIGVKIDYLYCPHSVPPVNCYCRKPSVAMAAYFIIKHKLNPSKCIYVGDSTSDKTFAQRSGFQYQHPNEFFK